MNSRKLRHVITIQQKMHTQSDTGSMVPSWKDYACVRAAIEPLSAREFIQSDANQSQVTARITIRYLDNLDPTMRILHEDKIYNPKGFLEDVKSGKVYITIPCSRGVNDGE